MDSYLGTGELEEKLLQTIAEAMRKNKNLKVQWYLDRVSSAVVIEGEGRGCRYVKGNSSAAMLEPLVLEFKER